MKRKRGGWLMLVLVKAVTWHKKTQTRVTLKGKETNRDKERVRNFVQPP